MSLVPLTPAAWRGAAAAGLLAVAAALSIGTLWRPDLAREAGKSINQRGADVFRTVASMIADRSPGERVEGELAMLKSRRAPLLHARALPKVRMPHPFAALVGTPPISEVVPPAPAPLFNLVAGAPPVIVPVAAIVGPPVILPPGAFFPGGPGGGGGVVVPPTVVTVPPDTPVTPTPQTSGVPEPKSWTMMLIGFALVGGTLRERRRLAS